jgi:hypothetical protein
VTGSSAPATHPLSNVVDGNTDSFITFNGYIANWVQMNLQRTFFVTHFTIYLRNPGSDYRFHLRVGNNIDANQNPICFTTGSNWDASSFAPYNVDCNLEGRYVTVQSYQASWLGLQEIFIHGYERKCGKLSWNLDNNGGWRSGCTTGLNTNGVRRKMMYTCFNTSESFSGTQHANLDYFTNQTSAQQSRSSKTQSTHLLPMQLLKSPFLALLLLTK